MSDAAYDDAVAQHPDLGDPKKLAMALIFLFHETGIMSSGSIAVLDPVEIVVENRNFGFWRVMVECRRAAGDERSETPETVLVDFPKPEEGKEASEYDIVARFACAAAAQKSAGKPGEMMVISFMNLSQNDEPVGDWRVFLDHLPC